MKVRCTGYKTSERNFTIGKTYIVDDEGCMTGENGQTYRCGHMFTPYSSPYEWLKANYYDFEEVQDNDIPFSEIVIQTDGHCTSAKMYKNRDWVTASFVESSSEDKFNYETDAKLALKKLFDALKVISVGDTVKVVDCGESYPVYIDWINKNAPEYAVYYKYDCKVPQDTVGTVVKKEQHSDKEDVMLYLIQTTTDACYLIGEEGIKKV